MPARNIKTQKWFTGPFFGTMQHAMQHKIEKTPYLRGFFHAADRNRTGTGIATHGILSPGRLPVPPRRQMGGGGFEPPKAVLADLQSVPFGHSGNRPQTELNYIVTESGFQDRIEF